MELNYIGTHRYALPDESLGTAPLFWQRRTLHHHRSQQTGNHTKPIKYIIETDQVTKPAKDIIEAEHLTNPSIKEVGNYYLLMQVCPV